MLSPYVKLTIASALPVAASALFYILERDTSFKKLSYALRQILIGLVFGVIAIIGTEWGIAIDGAMVNCRDAAPLCAGLLFGGPAGIIAGLIGGIERWIAVAWGVGSFTRLACTVSTILAGIYAALLRRFLFDGKKPGWMLALASGIVIEVFHLTMVFITNTDQAERAAEIVRICTVPMITANGLSIMIATMVITVLAGENLHEKHRNVRITQTIQRWLLIVVALSFLITTVFLYILQTQVGLATSRKLLSLELDDLTQDIRDASDENLLRLTHQIAARVGRESLYDLAYEYDVAEINLIDENGIIVDSTFSSYLGFDMASGEQSSEFLVLLDGTTQEYVQGYGPISYMKTLSRKYAGVAHKGGILQVGYNASQFQKDIASRISMAAVNRHIGENGVILIADGYRKMISLPRGMEAASLDDLGLNLSELPEDTMFSAYINGERCECMYRRSEGYYIVALLPFTEVFRTRNILSYVYGYIEVLIFAVVFGLIYLLIKRVVVDNIWHINRSLAKITAGNLNETVNVRSNEEFASLSDDINSTVDTLKRYISEAEMRIAKELEFAKSIQHSALPSVFPKRSEVELYASMDTAKEVGGDFYDFYFTEGDTLNFLIADVSGKGIPAAMFMMRAKTQLKGLTESGLPVNEVFIQGNNALCEGNEDMFVTAWQGAIDLRTGHVKFANAGHNPPLIKRDGKFEYLKTKAGMVLAGLDDIKYGLFELDLKPGDIIYLYTDGITEAMTTERELYGEERLIEFLNTHEFQSMKELCEAVKQNVDEYVGEADQFDDMTMLAIQYKG